MIPGDTLFYKCPKCKSITTKGSLLSGNTFGSVIYSDGKRIAPMLPDFPYLNKCGGCGWYYWLNDKSKVNDIIDDNKDPKYTARFLTIDEYFEALSKIHELDEKHERYIRFQIYWSYNDRGRNGEPLFRNRGEEIMYIGNILKIIKILDNSKIEDQLSLAEMLRNIGLFNDSLKILNNIKNKDYKYVVDSIKEYVLKENKQIFKLFE